MLRMVRDLWDQQIIDAQGRKVVRVTDVTFRVQKENGTQTLSIFEVDIGIRSIFRRLFRGVVPRRWIRRLQGPIPPNSIPWESCSILEADPQPRACWANSRSRRRKRSWMKWSLNPSPKCAS